MKLTGAEILCQSLEHLGVKHIFGYPGGAILPVYDALGKSKLHHILVRHEQGATHMADGYARATGGVGVAMATSGPGATNMVTGIATAMLDSSPVVCITGQVGSKLLGSDAFQEIDITGITMPITKHNVVVTRAEDIARTIREAFVIASSGRPGPVLVDITKDAQQTSTEFDWNAAIAKLPPKRVRAGIDKAELDRAIERPDGMRAHGGKILLVESGGPGRLSLLEISSDNGQLTTLKEGYPDGPVSVTTVGTTAYVLEAQLKALRDPNSQTKPFRASTVSLGSL